MYRHSVKPMTFTRPLPSAGNHAIVPGTRYGRLFFYLVHGPFLLLPGNRPEVLEAPGGTPIGRMERIPEPARLSVSGGIILTVHGSEAPLDGTMRPTRTSAIVSIVSGPAEPTATRSSVAVGPTLERFRGGP